MSPCLQLIFGIYVLLSVYAVFKSLVFNLHMFQLNTYRFDEEAAWLKKNLSRFKAEMLIFVLGFACFIPLGNNILMYIATVLQLVLIVAMLFENRQRPQKKKLVYTARVKRLTVTTLILVVLSFSAAVFMLFTVNKTYSFFFISLYVSLIPVYIILANLINKPIEKSICRYYLNDAKKMLRESPSLNIIGITGSYGKTSVKSYLATILETKFDTFWTPESKNTPMGLTIEIRNKLKSYHKIFVCEMGAKWVGDIKDLCDFVHPHDGIITALGEQHLESFGSRENIIKTKYELADALPPDGRLYVNWDCDIIRKNPPSRPFIKYGTNDNCDYYAHDITHNSEGTSFVVRFPDGSENSFETKLLGKHNVVNITGAIAAAHGYGMDYASMKHGVHKIEAVRHRMEIIPKNGITIIDDAFNSNPAGCRAALETLSDMDGIRILVTPGMVELGKEEDALNEEFGREAAKACDLICLIGEKQTLAIKKGIDEEHFNPDKIKVFEQFSDCMKYVYSLKKTDNKVIVLLENDLPDNY